MNLVCSKTTTYKLFQFAHECIYAITYWTHRALIISILQVYTLLHVCTGTCMYQLFFIFSISLIYFTSLSLSLSLSRSIDRNQSLGQRWIMVGVVRNPSLLACWHWLNFGPTLKFQQLKYCCWSNVGTTTTHQQWFLSSGANNGPTHTCRLQ